MKKRLLSILLAFCMGVGTLSTLTLPARANIYERTQTNPDGKVVVRCTWYAWERVYSIYGIELPNWGNGGDWLTGAAGADYCQVGTEPKVGALAVWKPRPEYGDSWGHVAYVTAVSENNITVDEGGSSDGRANEEGIFIGHNVPDSGYESKYAESRWPDGYIYFEQGSSSEPTPTDPFYQFDAETGTLTISGTKPIDRQWRSVAPSDNIKSIMIRNGIPSISEDAFSSCTNLETVSIPNSVTSIGAMAFNSCTKLTNITIPSGITSIGERAFSHCESLSNVTIPGSVTSIEDWTFYSCKSLSNITIPNGVTSIGEWAFAKCSSLKSITTPNSVAYIGKCAFDGCSNLSDVTISGTPVLGNSIINGCDNIKNLTLPATGFQSIFYNGIDLSHTHVRLTGPGAIPDMPTQDGLSFTSIELGDGITRIGNYAFWYSRFSNITIPNSVTTIGEYAFALCENLTSITLPDGLSDIESYAFQHCRNLTNITIPSSITSVGKNTFDGCEHLTNLTIHRDITRKLLQDITTEPGWAGPIRRSNFTDIYYGGSESDWKAIYHDDDRYLYGVTIHFNSTGPDTPTLPPDTPTPPASIKQIVQQLAQQALKNVLGVASIRCPVDVEISLNGQPVGQIVNNVASGVDESKIYIHVENDEKYIYFLTSEAFKINLTATGTGTMEYSVQNLDVPSWTTLDEKYFRKVELASGKKMVSDIDYLDAELVDTPNVQLYVLGDDSNPIKKVLPDDKGTEVPINTPVITFDITVDSISIPPMAVGDDGMLSELPVLTRSGYTFNGWYMPDGTKVDTNTVFTADTTIKAQWTKSSTGGDSPSNPGGSTTTPTVPSGPGYNPGGTYTLPTHSITTPSVTGGKVSISPSSASSGSIITVTTTPDTGYELAFLTVSDSTGKALELTAKGNGQYSFKMPNGKVSLSAEFRLLGTNTSWDNPFVDVSIGDWYYDAVKFVSENGLMNSVGNGYFSPNMNLSRAMFAQILYNKAGQPSMVGSSAFNDVPIGAWYTDAVTWAVVNNIVGGYGDGAFGPDDPITREQLAVMLWRYAGKPAPPNLLLNFTDADRVSGYALDALCWAVDRGIINGKGNGILDPKGFATRAEVAQVLVNYLSK